MAHIIEEITAQRTEDLRVVAMGMKYCSPEQEVQSWSVTPFSIGRTFFEKESVETDPFFPLLEAILQDWDGNPDKAIGIILDHFNALLTAKEFRNLDSLITSIPVADVSLEFSVAVLGITLPADHLLHSRPEFFISVWNHCTSQKKDPHDLLDGLRELKDSDKWFEDAVSLDIQGKSSAALDAVYDHIDEWLIAGEYQKCNNFLIRVPVEKTAPRLIYAIAILTRPASHHLSYWTLFMDRAWKTLEAHGKDAERLLGRLRADHESTAKRSRND